MNYLKFILILISISYLFGCSDVPNNINPKNISWAEVEKAANGTTVNMLAWMGDAATNRYLEEFVSPKLLEKYNITINFSSIAGPKIISFIMAEREADKKMSEADMVWMAGRQSYQMRTLEALYGPINNLLPNSKYLNLESPFIGKNYEIPLDGMEVPWGQGHFLLISDNLRVPIPPRTMIELEEWVKLNPGRFTFGTGFTTLAFLKTLLVEIAGGRKKFSGEFKEDLYLETSQKLWDYLKKIRPNLWREGKSFARSPAQLHQMFANGEVDFSMAYNNSEADKRIAQGVFPETAYGFTWESGTPKNATYLSIIKNAPNKFGALVVINFLISPEAQYEKLQLTSMGENSILSSETLPKEWKEKFLKSQIREHSPNQNEVENYAFTELRPEYITRLYNDFIKKFINTSP
ncbi:MAG: ABC transporter substrate-binding protein [Sphingomonadales bacterium]